MPHSLNQLTPNIHWFTPDNTTDRPILGLIVGSSSSLMVDAGASIKHTTEFLNALTNAGLPSPDYCALTHFHWDHSFGAEALDIPIIACKETAAGLKIQASYSFSDAALDDRVAQGLEIDFCRQYMKIEMNEAERLALNIRSADIVFENSLTLDLGGITCQLEKVGGDHAEDSVTLYIPEDKVLFLGDCAYQCLYTPTPHYTAKGVLALLDKLPSDVNHALESHTPTLYTSESFKNYRKTLKTFAELTQTISDKASLISEVQKLLPNLEQEDIDEYSTFFIDGLSIT